MSLFQRILFPVDLSEQCRRAAPFVKAMAERFHSEIVLLNTLENPMVMYAPPEAMAWAAYSNSEELRQSREEELHRFLADDFSGVRVRREFTEGEPAAAIGCYAKNNGVDLIMMPTHGYGPFRKLLLGSITAKVLHDTKLPVWTGVHTAELVAHDPKRFRRIVCAVDMEDRDAHLIRWAANLAAEQGAEVCLAHAVSGAAGERSDSTLREFLYKVARDGIAKLTKQAGVEFEVVLQGAKPARAIHDIARNWDADLVVVGRGRIQEAMGRLRSTAYAIIRESPCPVISV